MNALVIFFFMMRIDFNKNVFDFYIYTRTAVESIIRTIIYSEICCRTIVRNLACLT